MVAQPSGTVTLVFTDVEGSTRLLQELGRDAYLAALDGQRRLVRAACARHGGYEVDTAGDGFFYAFAPAGEAVAAVEEAMARPGARRRIRVRVGLHTGEPGLDPPKYVGLDVHKAARIMGAGHGGQVLLSQATRELVDGRELRDLGDHRLKDFDEPVRLFQLGTAEFPPLKTINNTNLPRAGLVVRRSRAGARRGRLAYSATAARGWSPLTGPGGSGKTRLAIEAAAEVVRRLPGRRLLGRPGAACATRPLVVETIAQTLGARADLAEHDRRAARCCCCSTTSSR